MILKRGQHLKYLPYAFTEQGVAMLSSVLNSERAIQVNVQIMRAFVRIRNLVADNADLRKAIQQIERRLNTHDQQIQVAFAALKGLLQGKILLSVQPNPVNNHFLREKYAKKTLLTDTVSKPPAPVQIPVIPVKEYTPDERKKMGFGKEGKNERRGKEGRKARK